MPDVLEFAPGNYKFIVAPGGPFSSGVAAMPGFALHRVRFLRPIPMADGFAFIGRYLESLGRPITALAGCELRSPAALPMDQFQAFNNEYLKPLHAWGCKAGDINPLARSNLAPITETVSEPSFFAFTYTVPEPGASGDFIISGKPENREGSIAAEIVGGRDVSPKGLETKARFVMDAMKARVAALGCDWNAATGAQIFTVHDIRPLLQTVFTELNVSQIGLAWFLAWPPAIGWEFEADVRSIRTELVIDGR